MAKLESNEYTIEIIPASHYYRWDGSDTNEFGYDISIYKNNIKQQYPLGPNNEMMDTFDIETMDYMISQPCFEAIREHKEKYADDLFNGGFDLFFIPSEQDWKITLYLNPYYLNHKEGINLKLHLSEDDLYRFARTLRLEEASMLATFRKI